VGQNARPDPETPLKKQNQRIVLEVLVGLVPVTFLLLPLLAAGAVGSPFAIFATLVDPQWPAAVRLQMILPLVWVDVWVVAAVAGVFAAWVLVLGSGTKFLDRRPIRIGLAGFLLLGIIAELRWFHFLLTGEKPYDFATWAWWVGLLLPPSVVGVLRLPSLFRSSVGRAAS